MKSGTKLGLQALGFMGLAGLGVAYAVHATGFSCSDLAPLASLGAGGLAMLLASSVGIFLADALRYRTMAGALGSKISWRTALETAIACLFFANVTPGGTMGAPAATYLLWRRGVPLGPATLIAFLKSLVSTIGLMLLAFGLLLVGLGPRLGPLTVALMTGATGLLALALVPIAWLRWRPAAAHALVRWVQARLVSIGRGARAEGLGARIDDLVDRIAVLPLASLPAIGAANALYFACFIGLLVFLVQASSAAPIPATFGTATVYLAFVYVAPTPGASGLAEGMGPDFFSGLLPAAQALAAVLAFRALTAWLQLVVGALHLSWLGGGDAVAALVSLKQSGSAESGEPSAAD